MAAFPGPIDPGWERALAPVAPQLAEISRALQAEADSGRGFLPAPGNVMRAFARPLADVRVLIVGQDPYPTPGHAIGLAFAVDRAVRPLPRSLQNIYRELFDDIGVAPPQHGDLSGWSEQGVMLLNRVLTVRPGASGSHRGALGSGKGKGSGGPGWESVTDAAIRALVDRGGPLVAILWGNDAARVRPLLGDVDAISSAHPSPLSASRGFFGSRPFSQANRLLVAQGAAPVEWRLD
jgi:uracil-DNA glycosylase